jgi:N-acetyl-gamma-glutamyl-phosphate reductase
VKSYEQWYGKPHAAVELQKEAVYCIPEINRADIKASTRILANPGCYPTAAQLPLVPLLKAGLIEADDIIIDAKSGTTGAGRAAKESSLYCEVADGIAAYGVASHRHAPEIEQGLGIALNNGKTPIVNFTPHLMPMSRGIEESIYVKMKPGVTAEDLKKKLVEQYANEPFVHILYGSSVPQTRHVRGSNLCYVNVYQDRVPGRAIILSVIGKMVL